MIAAQSIITSGFGQMTTTKSTAIIANSEAEWAEESRDEIICY